MSLTSSEEAELIAAARAAADNAYAPYSDYQVGSALLFDDGAIITGNNDENASYGLALCAETVAVLVIPSEMSPIKSQRLLAVVTHSRRLFVRCRS